MVKQLPSLIVQSPRTTDTGETHHRVNRRWHRGTKNIIRVFPAYCEHSHVELRPVPNSIHQAFIHKVIGKLICLKFNRLEFINKQHMYWKWKEKIPGVKPNPSLQDLPITSAAYHPQNCTLFGFTVFISVISITVESKIGIKRLTYQY